MRNGRWVWVDVVDRLLIPVDYSAILRSLEQTHRAILRSLGQTHRAILRSLGQTHRAILRSLGPVSYTHLTLPTNVQV